MLDRELGGEYTLVDWRQLVCLMLRLPTKRTVMRSLNLYCSAFISLLLTVLSTSCALDSEPARAHRVMHAWHDDGGSGKVAIRISLTDQIAEFERGGREIGWCYVATGKEGHGTPPGDYRIIEKIVDKYSNKYGWIEDEFGSVTNSDAKPSDPVPKGMVYVPAPMPYWMRLTAAGIGMHGGLIPEPGKPASHGCIRLPKEFVPILFDSVDLGAVVTITRSSRKYEIQSLGKTYPQYDASSPINSSSNIPENDPQSYYRKHVLGDPMRGY